jgi:hypothetical protein
MSFDRIGLGTNNPQADFHLVGNSIVQGNVTIGLNSVAVNPMRVASTGNVPTVYATHDGTNGIYAGRFEGTTSVAQGVHIKTIANNDSINSLFVEGQTTNVVVKSSGKVGLGTNTPTETLHVVGNGRITGVLSVGTLAINSYNVSSLSVAQLNSTTITAGVVSTGSLTTTTMSVSSVQVSSLSVSTIGTSTLSASSGIFSQGPIRVGSTILDSSTSGTTTIGVNPTNDALNPSVVLYGSTYSLGQAGSVEITTTKHSGGEGFFRVNNRNSVGTLTTNFVVRDTGQTGIGTTVIDSNTRLAIQGNVVVNGATTISGAATISGATALASSLSVGGSVNFRGNLYSNDYMTVGYGAVPAFVRVTNSGKLAITDNPITSSMELGHSSSSSRIDNNNNNPILLNYGYTGSVGIGATLAANGKLEVLDNQRSYGTFIDKYNSGYGLGIRMASSSASNYILYTTANGGSTPGLFVQCDGNVGVGVATPSNKLAVNGTIASTKTLSPSAGWTSVNSTDSQLLFYGSGTNWSGMGVDSSGEWWLRTGTGTQNVMVMDAGGNVGIGTSSTVARLQISCAVPNYGIRLFNTSANAGGMYINTAGSNINDGALDIQTGGGLFVVRNNGHVGIGTVFPIAPLQIFTSNSTSLGYSNSYFATTVSGSNPTATWFGPSNPATVYSIVADAYIFSRIGFSTLSDKRIKKDISLIDDGSALQTLRRVEPKKYKYIDQTRGNKEVFGFIAQDVYEEFPEATQIVSGEIPDIYKSCKVELPNKLLLTGIQSDVNKLCLRLANGKRMDVEVLSVEHDHILLSEELKEEYLFEGEVFVYGKVVDDLININKDFLFTINFAATQELDRQVQQLRQENAELKEKLALIMAKLNL